ncbi:MAG: polysaccharide deacetylase [Ruminococcus sp.]|nr:polysaccharide deacetylase [Ruminococcus sp.]
MSENNTRWNFENFDDNITLRKREEQKEKKLSESIPPVESKIDIKKLPVKKIAVVAVATLLLVLMIAGISACSKSAGASKNNNDASENNPEAIMQATVKQAEITAAQYDYDAAIALLKGIEDFENNEELKAKVASWEQEKLTLVEFPHDQVTHVFFHSLIYDPSLAFKEDSSKADGYNLVMTTVDEFNKMMESMYQKGYVMVSMHDICTFDEQGNRVDHQIMLPPDKKAFVLSQDDVNYYHYQDGDGIATKLVLDENGKVKNEYITKDGEKLIGDYDVVPLIDSFVEKHPDFSYRGRKGILALTGYNGALGYRTDSVYADRNDPNLDPDQIQFLDANPDFDYEKEVAEAKKVADALKATGWEFASHTWGHNSVPYMDMDHLKRDTDKWLNYVGSIVGETDVMIYPNGSDIAGTENYDSNNERFNYLTSEGFRIYCPVDSTPYWQQKGDDYFRMSRRNLDGYRMWHSPERLEDLFDVEEVFDKNRPTPVPTMEEVYG